LLRYGAFFIVLGVASLIGRDKYNDEFGGWP